MASWAINVLFLIPYGLVWPCSAPYGALEHIPTISRLTRTKHDKDKNKSHSIFLYLFDTEIIEAGGGNFI